MCKVLSKAVFPQQRAGVERKTVIFLAKQGCDSVDVFLLIYSNDVFQNFIFSGRMNKAPLLSYEDEKLCIFKDLFHIC